LIYKPSCIPVPFYNLGLTDYLVKKALREGFILFSGIIIENYLKLD